MNEESNGIKSNKNTEAENIENPRKYPLTFMTVIGAMVILFLVLQWGRVVSQKPIRAYNVGVSAADHVGTAYTGMILRDETVSTSEESGYIHFYAVEKERIKADTVLISFDDDPEMEKKLHELYYGQNILSETSRLRIQNILRQIENNYSDVDFQTALIGKTDLQSTIFKCLINDGGTEFQDFLNTYHLKSVSSERSGFFLTWQDGYENYTVSDLSSSDFGNEAYDMVFQKSGAYVEKGDFLYKTVEGNQFSLVFPLSESDFENYSGKKTLTVRLSDGTECNGTFSVEKGKDGTRFGVIHMKKYGYAFLESRYLTFEILDPSVKGFKIPETAITKKSFFVIPAKFVTSVNGAKGVNIRENGEDHFAEATIYSATGSIDTGEIDQTGKVYIYGDEITYGTTLVAIVEEDGRHHEETMVAAITAVTEGVYQINNGYCIFKPIVRIQNSIDSSYVIISSKIRGGLKSYDRIVLDARDIGEDELIFE